jgi:hypothetical protein
MSGVVLGSGGTGILEGHRPGTGLSGVSPLPPLVTGPTVVSGYAQLGTSDQVNTNYSSIPSIADGDKIVGIVTQHGRFVDTVAFMEGDGGPEWLGDQIDFPPVGSISNYWYARPWQHDYDPTNVSDRLSGMTDNRIKTLPAAAFSGVGPLDPVVMELSAIGDPDSNATFENNVVTFPQFDIPSGWSFVYTISKHENGFALSNNWTGATQLDVKSSTAFDDGVCSLAYVDGPQEDVVVTWEDLSGADIAAGGAVIAVIAVPGI